MATPKRGRNLSRTPGSHTDHSLPPSFTLASPHDRVAPGFYRQRTPLSLAHATDDMTMAALEAKNNEVKRLQESNEELRLECKKCLNLLDEAMSNHSLHRTTRNHEQEGTFERKAWDYCKDVRLVQIASSLIALIRGVRAWHMLIAET